MTATSSPRARPGFIYSILLAIGMAAVVGAALGFQYIGGYIPCALCLLQRQPYYYGIPVAALGAIAALAGAPRWITRALLAIGGIMMLVGGGIGVYHAGVEWSWWPGPTDCTNVVGTVDTGGNGVLDALDKYVPPSCDKAALRILGLSLAGWNAIASFILGVVAFRGAFARD